MKFVNVFLVILFLTATLQAQIPLFPYAYSQPYLQPPYSTLPYSTLPYSSLPYSVLPYFALPFSPADQALTFYTDQILDLTGQVQQLRSNIQQLQNELAISQAELARAPVPQVRPSAPEPPAIPMVLVFNNGERVESKGYVIVGQTLWFFTPSGYQSVSLSALNLDATKIENHKRGINFPSPGGGT